VEAALALSGVTKTYGRVTALDGLSFQIPARRLTGFLGPNGAGKTTTFRASLGLTRVQAGSITVLGMAVGPDTARIVKRVGAIVEEPGLLKTLSAIDNLKVAADTLGQGHEEIGSLLEFVQLDDVGNRRVAGFSKGMRQRLALAIALLGEPELLILDEPLDGLDPAGQVVLKRQLRELVEARGKTVIVSSHDLADVEQLADHVVVINRGRLVAAGALEEVLGTAGRFRVEVADPTAAAAVLSAAGQVAEPSGTGLAVEADDGAAISRALAGAGIYPSALVPVRATLESVFLELTEGS
jgi:ABC-2 type transport system ATP-binding protein